MYEYSIYKFCCVFLFLFFRFPQSISLALCTWHHNRRMHRSKMVNMSSWAHAYTHTACWICGAWWIAIYLCPLILFTTISIDAPLSLTRCTRSTPQIQVPIYTMYSKWTTIIWQDNIQNKPLSITWRLSRAINGHGWTDATNGYLWIHLNARWSPIVKLQCLCTIHYIQAEKIRRTSKYSYEIDENGIFINACWMSEDKVISCIWTVNWLAVVNWKFRSQMDSIITIWLSLLIDSWSPMEIPQIFWNFVKYFMVSCIRQAFSCILNWNSGQSCKHLCNQEEYLIAINFQNVNLRSRHLVGFAWRKVSSNSYPLEDAFSVFVAFVGLRC